MLQRDTPAEVCKLLFYFDMQQIQNLICFVINNHETLLISQISNQFFLIFRNTIIRCSQVHLQQTRSIYIQQEANIERCESTRYQPIVVREIWPLIYIIWLQQYSAIHYRKQLMLKIYLELNVMYSVLRSLISFQEAP